MRHRNERALDLARHLIREGLPAGMALHTVELGHPPGRHRGEVAPTLTLGREADLGCATLSVEVLEDGRYGLTRRAPSLAFWPAEDPEDLRRLLAEVLEEGAGEAAEGGPA